MPEVRLITMKDPFYQKERELRNDVLLRPIEIPDFGWEMHDDSAWHFIAVDSKTLIGCVLLVPLDDEKKKGQLIQMAVDSAWQGKGIGRLLVESLLSFASSEGFKEIEIHSRAEVSRFYEHLGFEVFGDSFEEVGVKHRYLRKRL